MRAAIYVRISRDPEGEALGVQRQEEDLQSLAQTSGYQIAQVYRDNDLSASTRSRKRRPGYDRMLQDARAGEFGVIMAYTSSRLTRRPRENEDLIELAEDHRIRFVYLRSPSFDLNTADGRNVARILAANDAAESERISERVSRAAAQRKAMGLPHGGRKPFSNEEWIREAATRLLAGESIYGVCADWNRKGRRTQNGVVWRSRTLTRILRHTTLLPAEDATRVRALLSYNATAHKPFPAPVRKYPLVGLLRCGKCDHILHSMTSSKAGKAAYFCSTQANGGCGKLRIAMAPLEEFILQQVVAALEGISTTTGEDHSEEIAALHASIIRAEASLEQMDTDHYDGLLDRTNWLKQRSRVSGRLSDLQRQLSVATSQSIQTIIPTGPELISQWSTRDAMWKRTMLSAVIDHVVIAPFPEGMTTHLSKRKTETDEEYEERTTSHAAEILVRRVNVVWKV